MFDLVATRIVGYIGEPLGVERCVGGNFVVANSAARGP